MRVLIENMPRMLQEIIEQAITGQPDMEVVDPPVSAAVSEHLEDPDVVIIGAAEADDASVPSAVLVRWPRSRVVTIATQRPVAVLYWLRQHQTPLGEISTARLVETIRLAAAVPSR
jgi:hypothetical protein